MSGLSFFRRWPIDPPKREPETHAVEDVTLCVKLTGGREATRYFMGYAARSDSCYPSYNGERVAEEFVCAWKNDGVKIIGGHVALWSEFVSATVERCSRTVVLP